MGDQILLGSRSDPDLSSEGRAQAERAAHCFGTRSLADVVVSPLLRTRRTAETATPQVSLRIDGRIRDIDYGVLSGLSWEEAERRYPREFAAWRERSIAPTGAETLASVTSRVLAHALDATGRMEEEGEDLVFVTHDLPIQLLVATARGWSPEQWNRVRVTHAGLRVVRVTSEVRKRWTALVR